MPKDTFNNPFEKLKGVKLKKAKPVIVPPPKPKPAEPSTPEDEEELFSSAMGGVARITKQESGRQVAATVRPAPSAQATDPDAEAKAKLYDLVAGKVEFELEYTDEFVLGFVKGMDQKIFRQLKAGQLSPEAHQDLHGLNAEQAYQVLLAFVREKYFEGKRCLLLIPGRGINSPGGMSVLKQELKSWLTRDPLKRVVLAFCTAQPRHGGAGAIYVLLRQRRKNEGKIRWENLWGDD